MSVETPDFADMLARMVRAYGRRVGDGDPIDLTRMLEVRREFDQAIVTAVRAQNDAGFSWAELGEALGTRRQSAWATYGRRTDAEGDDRGVDDDTDDASQDGRDAGAA